jgi:hypothetical protein
MRKASSMGHEAGQARERVDTDTDTHQHLHGPWELRFDADCGLRLWFRQRWLLSSSLGLVRAGGRGWCGPGAVRGGGSGNARGLDVVKHLNI